MESLNDVKHIGNGKDSYIDGKILKTDLRYVPKLLEASRIGEGEAVNCDMSNPSCCTAICYKCCNAKNEY
jgi:hypothetical protein